MEIVPPKGLKFRDHPSSKHFLVWKFSKKRSTQQETKLLAKELNYWPKISAKASWISRSMSEAHMLRPRFSKARLASSLVSLQAA